ncbi:uncharacterized protein LOC122365467 isoform X2 [Amphibalanus amphitrite]|uniref:uncharacterized protein LOC122365467 isoform X1 n=1 Tax=Amphibalanus amphitrite TaxID=1232801 RepID=UPI001C8FB6E4|nr:uncharacterized protein LOC122365467 isoform X1 [Amphibalanus amphitrite]XP_043192639.1 uncharacterized protein LOC122365467 isoform X2 [Amphibalanus amphitrite]
MRSLIACLAVLAVTGYVQASVFSVGHVSSVARNGKIKFYEVLADSDGSWNYRRSHFKCTDPGYYYISFHGLCKKNFGLTLKLVQNNAEVVRAHGDGVGYNTASNSAIVYLNYHDTVSLRVADGFVHESDHLDRRFVTLSGYKVSGSDGTRPQLGTSGGGSDGTGPQFGTSGGGSDGTGPQLGTSGGEAFGAPPAGAAPAPDSEEDKEEEFTPLSGDTSGPSR